MRLKVRLSEIKQHFADCALFSQQLGDDCEVNAIQAVENCQQGGLTFVSNADFLQRALLKQPTAMVIAETLLEHVADIKEVGFLVTKNVKLAHALIKSEYGNRDYLNEQWGNCHPSAVIHPTAVVPASCYISPNVVIGADTVLGEHCRLQSGVVIENNVTIGERCIFHPNSVVGYQCEIGNEVEIGAGTVIGSEGFGFAQDSEHKSHKIPQTGKVVIKDRVLLGANNAIDRATYGQTVIGAGTKMDNFVHIAHNVTIGQDCLFTPMLAMAGSSKMGDRCITSGHTGISDHITIADDVQLFQFSAVTKDIKKAGAYAGPSVLPLKDYFKNNIYINKLSDLNKKVKQLERQLKKT